MEVIPVSEFPVVEVGDNVANLIVDLLEADNLVLATGDILVVAHTIISIAEGSVYQKSGIEVSERAVKLSSRLGTDPIRTEVALRESIAVIRDERRLITRTKHGLVTDMSGVDESNAPPGLLIALPDNPDLSAREIHQRLKEKTGRHIPVVIADTQGRPWRKGSVNIALGVAGMTPFIENEGKKDLFGKSLQSSLVCVADEIAQAAELVMGQAGEGVPIAIIRGVNIPVDSEGSAKLILRTQSTDLFT